MIETISQTLLRTASLDDMDPIVELHTQARTAYYQAGGLSEAELTSPEARSVRACTARTHRPDVPGPGFHRLQGRRDRDGGHSDRPF